MSLCQRMWVVARTQQLALRIWHFPINKSHSPAYSGPVRSIGTLSRATVLTQETKQQRPTVLLLGWAFSTINQLSKYAELHNRLGFDVLHHILPPPHFFTFDHARIRYEAGELVRELANLGCRSVVTHAIGNNGYIVYQHVADLLRESDRPDTGSIQCNVNLGGAIYDSCPSPSSFLPYFLLGRFGQWGLRMGRDYLSWDYLKEKLRSDRGGDLIQSVNKAYSLRTLLHRNWIIYLDEFESPGAHGINNAKEYPQLYLYSSADKAAYPYMEMLMEAQENSGKGQLVAKHDFKLSRHLEHLDMFPQEYEGHVTNFMSFVMKGDSQQQR